MEIDIPLCYSEIVLHEKRRLSATQLRSFIGYKFIENTEFHHHDDNPYRYPLIQYKRINDSLYILGIAKYADLVFDRVSELQHITLKNTDLSISNIVFEKTTHAVTEKICKYRFISPWIALNAENYTKYNNIDLTFHKKFLENILTGNLLSMLKGLDIRIDYTLYVEIKWFKHMPITAHKHGFSGFYAEFITNLDLPEHIGIGKSVSKGFGIIQKMKTS